VSDESPDRWVDGCCSNLLSELRDRMGGVEMWRDTEVPRAGDAWRPEIAEAVESTGIFPALFSPTCFDSDECHKELDRHEFFVWEDRAFRELNPKRDAEGDRERMATDLTVALEALHGQQRRDAAGKVFISRLGPELLQVRKRLRGALRERGLHVVPAQRQPAIVTPSPALVWRRL